MAWVKRFGMGSLNNNIAILNIYPAFYACIHLSINRKYNFTWNARGFQQRNGQKSSQKVMFARQRCDTVTECVHV